MLCRIAVLVGFLCSLGSFTARAESTAPVAIVSDQGVSFAERLAAKEVRRYLYLRSGKLLPIVVPFMHDREFSDQTPSGPLVVVAAKDRPIVTAFLLDVKLKAMVEGLAAEQYMLKTFQHNGRPVLLVVGGDPMGTLYGAYRLAEHLGVRFYLHGDVLPDKQVPLDMPNLDEVRKPLFALRGIQPFHDFPEGPDWWNRDGYKAVIGQLPKMGMNFFGLHCYPPSGVGPEPLVWIGRPSQINADGTVKASYPARHFTASNVTDAWGYLPGRTGDYLFGAADLFDRDDYGADYMRDTYPWPAMSPRQCNALFDRMGEFLADAFAFARRLGVKTCIGTETPLVIPDQVKSRLRAAGKNPNNPAVVEELYEGMFRRIAKVHPLDYYWLWTPETWTWEAVKQGQIDGTMADFRAALGAAKKVHPPFTLATCGWVLGPPQSPSLFDEFLPKEMPMSCINRNVGNTPVEPGFAKIKGRPKWAIPWLEDDAGLTMPQLWAGRMRRDAADARKYGCTGLMGIHWRTRILGPNVSALAHAAWDQTGWQGRASADSAGTLRYAPVDDFYADWARAEFGAEAAEPIAALFVRLDGRLPRPTTWVTGPGSIKPDPRPWEQAQKEYAFVDDLAALRPHVVGPGNLERFDYWLNTFGYLRSVAEVRCVWARFNAALDKTRAEKDPNTRKTLAREFALPARIELIRALGELHKYLLATVSNPGEMGSVCNWQQQTLPVLLTTPGQELAELLGEDLPPDAEPSKEYAGPPRLFVPEVRTGIMAGEMLKLTVDHPGCETASSGIILAKAGERRVRPAPAATRGPRRIRRRASRRGR